MAISALLRVALKEWDAVCQMLATGDQIMLLRKGGIQESGGEFELEHRQFLLFPTFLHQDRRLVREPYQRLVTTVATEPSRVSLTLGASVNDILRVPRLEPLQRLGQEHLWTDELLQMRWNYRPENPLYILLLRVWRLGLAQSVANTPAYAGCRSWVTLDEPISTVGATPILNDRDFALRRDRLLHAFAAA